MMNSGTNELLQNLDMEMQLLKKKREVIEQQMICSQRMQLQNEYNPGPSNVSYGHQYQTVNRPAKRQSITPWQNEPLTKIGRYVSQEENSWYQTNQSSYPPKTSKHQYNPFHQYKNKQPNNKFVPTKVEKYKPRQKNNLSVIRPNQAPVRNTLINETRTVKKSNDDIFAKDILYPDKVPTEKMTGRLELALGMILKELRKEYWNVNVVKRFFDIPITKRELKFTIRERLRDLLLGKPVPHYGTIHTMYRRKYPIESDAELINIISQNHNLKDRFKKFYLVFKPTEEPQDFVENNFKNIISNKLRDMFKEIEVIYKNKSEEEMMKCTVFDDMHIVKDPNEPRPFTEENEDKKDNIDQPVDMNKPYKDMSNREKLYYIKKHIHETVNAHLPSLLASCASDISNLLCDQESTKLLKGSLVTRINPKFKGMFLKKTNFDAAEGKPESANVKGKYYAKVSCHPRLPSREEMQPFLYSFKPCAIKKPKNSDGIVLVLFNTKEERDALLAANGTVLHDKYPLNIVAAEAVVPTQQRTASNDNKDVTRGTDSENDNKDIKPDNKDATTLDEHETVVKSESSDDKNDNTVTKANDEQTDSKTEESSKAGENNEEQASSDKIAEMSNKDIEIDNENLTHDADTEMSEVIKPDNKDNGPSNDEDTEINKINIEQESSNNGDLETSNEDSVANTSLDYGDVISSDLDQQIDDLLTSISRSNAETETDDNESKKDSLVDDESKVDQTPTVELDDDNSKSNEELKINEDLTAEGDSAMVIDYAKEIYESNPKVDTDENNAKVDTDESNPKVVTDENNAKVDTDENNAKVDSDESKAGAEIKSSDNTTAEKVKEDAKSSNNESVGPVRASGRIATRRSSRFVTNN